MRATRTRRVKDGGRKRDFLTRENDFERSRRRKRDGDMTMPMPMPMAMTMAMTITSFFYASTPSGGCALESSPVSLTSIHREKYSVDRAE